MGSLVISSGSAPNQRLDSFLCRLVLENLCQIHFSPRLINDQLSRDIYSRTIESLDPAKMIFTSADLAALSRYKNQIDNELLSEDLSFYQATMRRYQKQISKIMAWNSTLIPKTIPLVSTETYLTDPKKWSVCTSDASLRHRWQQWAKFQAVSNYLDAYMATANVTANRSRFSTQNIQLVPQLVTAAIQTVQTTLKNRIDGWKNETEADQFSVYLNAICAAYDPHTAYMVPDVKEDFDISMKGSLEGIGAVLADEGGVIKITSVVPGSPAGRSNQISAGDEILKIGQNGQDFVPVTGTRLRDVVKQIRGKKGTKVTVVIRKPDGHTEIVPLVRDVIVMEESYARSLILQLQPDGPKIGYIQLPSFYRDFTDYRSRNAADDIHKELLRLSRQGVSGIILDIRNNGGGALDDAIRIAGEFVESGPIVQVKTGNSGIQILKDVDGVKTYAGPVVILVNRFSASASEILSAALQDYGRAVIVGSTTFGKGTVQRFFSLDEVLNRPKTNPPLGSLKLTIQKFYRVTGGSTQVHGVVPDIHLPDYIDTANIGEGALPNRLPYDTIPSVLPTKDRELIKPLAELNAHAQHRLMSDPTTKLITSTNSQLRKIKQIGNHPLGIKSAWAYRQNIKTNANRITELLEKLPTWSVALPAFATDYIKPDMMQNWEDWRKRVAKDRILYEASQIMTDMINSSN